jgi:FtsP/CotA-like multicopper oxidase with cupredoxin domain
MATAIGGYITGPAIGQQAPRSQPFADPLPLLQSPPPGVVKPPAGLRARAARIQPTAEITPPRVGAERFYDLTIQMIPATIEDPSEADPADPERYKPQQVNLRGYADTNRTPGPGNTRPPFVAPEIEATPGDTIRITLRNKLDPKDPSCTGTEPMDSLHCFNVTNLHSHGLWVSPTGNSDNVLLSIKPGVDFQYEYNIPADHPAGTFWYHPHQHGSTGLQVGSGMAGAIIIKGDRLPVRDDKGAYKNGDLDTLLIDPASNKPFLEHVLLFQQIPYACRTTDGKIDVYPDGPRKGQWQCQDNAVGEVSGADQFLPSAWTASGRWTSINGLVLPRFGAAPDKKIDAGQVVRMRLIHGGIRDTIKVQFRKKTPRPAPLPFALSKDLLPAVIKGTCDGDIVPYQVVAADGLTMDRTLTEVETTLQPGYRYDLLTIFPEAGEYCMLDLAKEASDTVARQDVPTNLLGFVTVGGTRKITDVTRELVDTLVKSAQAHMPAGVRDDIVKDLRTMEAGRPTPHLTRFAPHPTVTDDEVKGVPDEDMVFFLGPFKPNDSDSTKFTVGNDFAIVKNADSAFIPKGATDYDPTRVDRHLTLGTAQTWELRSYGVSHPFHIHVNPFQIVAILNPDGFDISQPGVADTKDGKDGKDGKDTAANNEYAGLKNVWKDTLFVRTKIPFGGLQPDSKGYYRFIVRTRYERYIGEFVLHCHILDHEDSGMMQNVQIDLPVGPGGMSHEHH